MSDALNPIRSMTNRLAELAESAGRYLHLPLRLAIGAIFIWSGIAKLLDPQSFVLIIQAYGLLPSSVIPAVAVGLALIETVVGTGLLFNVPLCLEAIAAMLAFFMAILGYGLWLGLDIDCGCFGAGDPEGAAYHSLRPTMYRDAFMLAVCGFIFYRQRRRLNIQEEKVK